MSKFLALKNLGNDELKSLLEKISSGFQFMNQYPKKEISEYTAEFLKSEILQSVTFFGGSFHPMHRGHLECLNLCPEENIIVVLDRNPFKEVRSLNLLSEIQNIIDYLNKTKYSIYPGFWLKNEVNYTADWIVKVNIENINLLMGDDSFFQILKWKNPDVIAKKIKKLYVVPRKYQVSELQLIETELKKFNQELKVIYLSDHDYKDLSSTKLRSH